jgi:hypothetical protein
MSAMHDAMMKNMPGMMQSTRGDSAFGAMQERGKQAMGVDQYTSTHRSAAGNFSIPEFVHVQNVPGTTVMAAKRNVITYIYRELPRGGEVRIVTKDADAIAAVHEFLAFQQLEHRTK